MRVAVDRSVREVVMADGTSYPVGASGRVVVTEPSHVEELRRRGPVDGRGSTRGDYAAEVKAPPRGSGGWTCACGWDGWEWTRRCGRCGAPR